MALSQSSIASWYRPRSKWELAIGGSTASRRIVVIQALVKSATAFGIGAAPHWPAATIVDGLVLGVQFQRLVKVGQCFRWLPERGVDASPLKVRLVIFGIPLQGLAKRIQRGLIVARHREDTAPRRR